MCLHQLRKAPPPPRQKTGSYSPTKTLSQIVNSDSVQVLSKFVEIETDGSVKKRRVLTEEQRQKIEQNRLRAIEIQKNLKQRENQKDDSTTSSKPVDNIRLNQNRPDSVVSSTKSSNLLLFANKIILNSILPPWRIRKVGFFRTKRQTLKEQMNKHCKIGKISRKNYKN